MSGATIIECTSDAELQHALEGSGWLISVTRQPDGTLKEGIVIRHRKTGILASIPASDAERLADSLPFAAGAALREAAERIRAERPVT